MRRGPSSPDLPLRSDTPRAWAEAALAQPLVLLDDHAHLEEKAAVNALTLLQRAPRDLDPEAAASWVRALAAVARDETEHLLVVLRLLARRGGSLSGAHRNPYAAGLHALARRSGGPEGLVDHLLVCALIEARSSERFAVLAVAARDDDLRALYRGLRASERGHFRVFLDLAKAVPRGGDVPARFEALLDGERDVLARQAPGPRMHAGAPG